MTNQSHDQFAKEYLEELLAPFGTVKINRNVRGEVRQIDVWFAPSVASLISELGLLGRMASTVTHNRGDTMVADFGQGKDTKASSGGVI